MKKSQKVQIKQEAKGDENNELDKRKRLVSLGDNNSLIANNLFVSFRMVNMKIAETTGGEGK